ncbi:hypothetical membrane protein [Corynebacterium kutscheri]|uniref:Hypothetical membrane protein n=1 Tax=Corynebacterium kutscheri TaxID=35755 RepID=A0A0F6TDD4_9CORY|nr:hypothetical protein [Corynebacterium kutscheri]AKE41519.1 hypothetical protein UL82_06770 [Corynebacterium kutscheri]VEH08797.1 hypothetical membrane protein [Corynebacterium kutscheri]VEH09843.1 hypothetical membrane protein [Corynebacterium kutscheri]VEH79926.1 hypothetical membrane protein [Corynebacterium kutscheri]
MNNYWLVYLLFMIAGFLVGGVWTAYKNGSTIAMIVLGVLAFIAGATGIFWAMGMS